MTRGRAVTGTVAAFMLAASIAVAGEVGAGEAGSGSATGGARGRIVQELRSEGMPVHPEAVLSRALEKGDVAAVREMLAEDPKLAKGNANPEQSALSVAVFYGNVEIVKMLVLGGAKLEVKDKRYHFTPLFYAVASGNRTVVEFLIERGADVNAIARDATMGQILFMATGGDKTAIGRFVRYRGGVEPEFFSDVRPLHIAAAGGKTEIVELLVSKGARVNVKSAYGETPLYFAAFMGHTEVVEGLLEAGADVNAKTKAGLTPAYFHTDIFPRLSAFRYEGEGAGSWWPGERTALMVALARDGDEARGIEIANLLLDKGADVKAVDNMGFGALHYATWCADAALVRRIVARGAELNLKNSHSGVTALHCAAIHGNREAAEALIKAGADVNARNDRGRTALTAAESGEHADVAALLRANGGTK